MSLFQNKVKRAVEQLIKHLDKLEDEVKLKEKLETEKKDENNDNNNNTNNNDDKKKSTSDEEDNYKKYVTKVAKDVYQIHFILYGDADTSPKSDEIKQLSPLLYSDDTNLFEKLSKMMIHMTFECKKHCAAIMNYLVRRVNKNHCHKYINNHKQILINLLKGYKNQSLAQNVGSVLQEMSKRTELGPTLFEIKTSDNRDIIFELLELVKDPSFDIASDAFKTLETLLTRNKNLCSEYLKTNYDQFFNKFHQLIESDNYVTQRQFLKLLSTLLLDRKNFSTMLKYVNQKNNLRVSMQLLKHKSKAISFEAFHIFKVFVANPKKERDIHIVLWKNKDKLIKFLSDFLKEKEKDDSTFADEKLIVIDKLKKLEEPEDLKKQELNKAKTINMNTSEGNNHISEETKETENNDNVKTKANDSAISNEEMLPADDDNDNTNFDAMEINGQDNDADYVDPVKYDSDEVSGDDTELKDITSNSSKASVKKTGSVKKNVGGGSVKKVDQPKNDQNEKENNDK